MFISPKSLIRSRSVPSTPLTANTTVSHELEIVNSGLPVRLKTPSIDVNTAIESVATHEPEIVNSGLAMRLKIPSINVDTAIESVGTTPDGAMDIAKSIENVAWYKFSKSPGDNGSAVIAGHYGSENGKRLVFDNLHKLSKGDKLYIEDDKGEVISFVVRASRSYDPKEYASDVFLSNDGKSHLNLITCEGVWNQVAKSYSMRLVVFTDKE